MPLSPGDKLGHFEVVAPIGAGGMGEVYCARDTRLDRTVAIKVIHGLVASDDAMRERFEREARAVSSLNHPNICTLHDVGSERGIDFIVMEHLEGESLADRLKKSRLPFDEALRYGIQIADALDAAHRQGVVHRDLKPGNVMLTPSGAKLLDFGLAKTQASDYGEDEDSAVPTAGKPLTEKGAILGTFQYMAPEQLEGREADARTDIFSYGALLYEMLTGEKAFTGNSQASLISAIMSAEPRPLASLQPMTPRELEHVVERCLQKDPESRWQSARDVKLELEWLRTKPDVAPTEAPRAIRLERLAWVAALVAAVIATGVVTSRFTSFSEPGVSRLEISLPSDLEIDSRFATVPVAISPDGRRIVYAAVGGGRESLLFVRSLNGFHAEPLEGTEEALNPTFSPDGQWVAYFADGKLFKISVEGGAPFEIADAPFASFGAAWNDDGNIIFDNAYAGGGLMTVSADGGTPESFSVVDDPGVGHFKPKNLPRERGTLLSMGDVNVTELRAAVLPTGSHSARLLSGIPAGANVLGYVLDGYLIYTLSGDLWSVPFDLSALEPNGPSKLVLDGISGGVSTGGLHPFVALSGNGTLVYAAGRFDGQNTLSWVDRSGHVTMTDEPAPTAYYATPRLSPDGSRLMVVADSEAWILDLARGTRSRFVEPATFAFQWSPDGRRVVYTTLEGIYEYALDGSAEPRLILPKRTGNQFEPMYSPDGGSIVFYELHPRTGRDIWMVPVDGGEPTPLVATEASERSPRISPNGRWLAYASNEGGRDEVYVRPFPQPGKTEVISANGGREPVWSRDGTELFYRRGDELIVVDVDTEGDFRAGTPKVLLTARFGIPPGGLNQNYDVSPDGERFVFVERDENVPRELRVILNWFSELDASE